MILIDTDAAVLDEADIYDGDLQFECDTAAGSKRIVISLAPNQALDLDVGRRSSPRPTSESAATGRRGTTAHG